jgi:hypothetical protein
MQLKAPAAICIVLAPCRAGEVVKSKVIVALLFDRIKLFAGIPLKVKSLASRVAGSTGSLTSTTKTVGRTKIPKVPPQPDIVTVQGVAVNEITPSRNAMMAMTSVVFQCFISGFCLFCSLYGDEKMYESAQRHTSDFKEP